MASQALEIYPLQVGTPFLKLPNRSHVPARDLCSVTILLPTVILQEATQSFFPVISIASTLVFCVIRKVIAVIFYAL